MASFSPGCSEQPTSFKSFNSKQMRCAPFVILIWKHQFISVFCSFAKALWLAAGLHQLCLDVDTSSITVWMSQMVENLMKLHDN
ncbi:hypothetical protein FRX31_017459 [Thalictrum thalictroides]|uniref:Uncharacterized protein n=1 Tax=Thalictrum thalictroides TaxID=46969 RepID=A0A7J6W992_THATH|nr:hypothetical protein FRX31_017459 [Thalictrum thalictroides]